MKLKHITFTGIDDRTNIGDLMGIQKEHPFVEFGVLMSRNWKENGNRYMNPEKMKYLRHSGLDLSAHLCGMIAREAYSGNWQPAFDASDYELNMGTFKRVQLNIGSCDPETMTPAPLANPIGITEIIVQQKSPTMAWNKSFIRLLGANNENSGITMLIDPSGGNGIDHGLDIIATPHKTGYAGGINAVNVEEKLRTLFGLETVGDFWIDMESSVRTDDWFDINKVVKVLEICQRVINEFKEF